MLRCGSQMQGVSKVSIHLKKSMAYSSLSKVYKIFYKQLEKILNPDILLNLLIHGILDFNVKTTNFETFQPSFEHSGSTFCNKILYIKST